MTGLLEVLGRARARGFLGPGPLEPQLDHARGFLPTLEGVAGRLVDLGSGGGLPGLVVAVERPDLEVVLLDAMARRCRFLDEAVAELGVSARVQVIEGRAEELGRGPLRARAQAVVARAFGPPAVTAECAAPLLVVGGRLVVSEPPDASERWPADRLAELGLVPGPVAQARFRYQVLLQERPCSERYPRRVGVPAKRPLF